LSDKAGVRGGRASQAADPAGRTVLSFASPHGGMQAHYLARWVTRRGAIGPWSDTASATVAA
jgi:hypothetical protein